VWEKAKAVIYKIARKTNGSRNVPELQRRGLTAPCTLWPCGNRQACGLLTYERGRPGGRSQGMNRRSRAQVGQRNSRSSDSLVSPRIANLRMPSCDLSNCSCQQCARSRGAASSHPAIAGPAIATITVARSKVLVIFQVPFARRRNDLRR
jgi:hypothetical protein